MLLPSPGRWYVVAQRLRTVTFIAARSVVVEVAPKIRTALDGYLVISVEMSVVTVVAPAQFFENDIERRFVEVIELTVTHAIRHPATVNAAPVVTYEAQQAQATMHVIVAACCRCLTRGVEHLMTLPFAGVTASCLCQVPAPDCSAGATRYATACLRYCTITSQRID
ncbi:MAG TPA: hypothetical protein VGP83_17035 [Pyrinomonadaceae bacterium]|nr:hypothetical protein [Pyrinomonadaceae bacterium]